MWWRVELLFLFFCLPFEVEDGRRWERGDATGQGRHHRQRGKEARRRGKESSLDRTAVWCERSIVIASKSSAAR